jgi:hypothetical protein
MPIFLAILLQAAPQGAQPLSAYNATVWNDMSAALHQSLDRVLSLLIAILPGILAFFVALAVFTVIGIAPLPFADQVRRSHCAPPGQRWLVAGHVAH